MATTRMEYDTSRARTELGYTSMPARDRARARGAVVRRQRLRQGRAGRQDPRRGPADRRRSTCEPTMAAGRDLPHESSPSAHDRPEHSRPSTYARCSSSAGAEAFALHERYMNPQMPQILRTIGFDADYVRAEGAYLFDRDGRRYLDFLSGFGVFALGRCHPGHRTGAARRDRTARCRTSCRWSARRSRVCSPRRSSRVCRTTATAASSRTAARSRSRPSSSTRAARPARSRILFADHAFHGLTMGALSLNGAREFRDRFGNLLPGCQSVPFGDLDALAARARGRRRRRVRRRADPGQGRVRRARGLPARRGRAVPPPRRAARDRRGADRARPHRHVLRVRAVGRRARPRHRRQGALGRLRAGRRGDREERRSSNGLRQDGPRRRAQLDVRPERAGDDRGARDAAHDRRGIDRRTRVDDRRVAHVGPRGASPSATSSCTRSAAAG